MQNEILKSPTSADIRAEIARANINIYELAAQVKMNPSRLGMMLNERVPLPFEISEKILEALEKK